MNGGHDAGCITRTQKIEGSGGVAISLAVMLRQLVEPS